MESIHEIGKFENYRSNPGCRETIDFFFSFLSTGCSMNIYASSAATRQIFYGARIRANDRRHTP